MAGNNTDKVPPISDSYVKIGLILLCLLNGLLSAQSITDSRLDEFREKLEKTTDPIFSCKLSDSEKKFTPLGYCDGRDAYALIAMGSLLNATYEHYLFGLMQLSVVGINGTTILLSQIGMLNVNGAAMALVRLTMVDGSVGETTLFHSAAYSFGESAVAIFKIDAIKSSHQMFVYSALQFSLINVVGFDSFRDSWRPKLYFWKASKKDGLGFRGVFQVGAINMTYTFGGFVQLGAIFSFTGTFRGFLQTGLINSAGYDNFGASLAMTQEEELQNETVTDEKTGEVTELGQAREGFRGGMQVGVWNTATKFAGIGQFGILNMAQTMKGTQTGVVNVARTVYGAQIGLVNYTGDLYGFQIGLVNIVKNNKVPFMPIVMASF